MISTCDFGLQHLRYAAKKTIYINKILEKEPSDLIEYEADIRLLAEAATQTAEDLKTKRLIGSSIITRMNVHLDLCNSHSYLQDRP